MNVLVLHSQVPFVTGGAEVLVSGLVGALRERGYAADSVALPLAWSPVDGLLTTALAWRLLDLSSFNERRVDRVICTKFPTWAANHPHKSLWLVHQHRQAHDLHGTALSEFTPEPESRAVRQRVLDIDRVGIGACRPRFAISRNVSRRLREHTGLEALPLYPPVPRVGLCAEAYEPFILSAARLDAAKRVDRLIAAWPAVDSRLRLVIAGDGPERGALQRQANSLGIADRVRFLGRVGDDELTRLFNTCRAVYYAPIDEDYGYAAVESLAAGKAVIAAPDSGGVLEFVTNGDDGIVCDLETEPLARALNHLSDERVAREFGATGPRRVAGLTWDVVVEQLLGG